MICVTPFDFFSLIKRVTQFLITPSPSNEGKKCLVSKKHASLAKETVRVISQSSTYFPPCSLFLSFDTIISLKHLLHVANV